MPNISVIVPVYNTEKYLDRCIQSILSQTYTDFELLLINDGSTDSSGVICERYAEQDSRVRVFHKKNGGVSSARNMGLDNARGEWIGWVDSDDYVDADMYVSLYNAAISKNADIAYCNYRTDNWTSMMPSDSLPKGEFLRQYLLFPVNALWLTLAKRELYHKNNLRFDVENNYGEDLLVTSKLYYYASEVASVNHPFYFYHSTPSSLTSDIFNNPTKVAQLLNNSIEIYDFFNKTEVSKSVKNILASRVLLIKKYYLYGTKNISKWYSIAPWSHNYIFSNIYNGKKGKIIEWLIVRLYRLIVWLTTLV